MGAHKKEHGINAREGGEMFLYRGMVLLRQEIYSYRWCRNKVIERWKKDIKQLNGTEQYYLVFKPNTR